MMNRPVKHQYLPTLDGWRAVAIIGVLMCHGLDYPLSDAGPWANPRLFAWTRLGAYGVDIFFGLSGFLITRRLMEELDLRGRIDLAQFYGRRAFRILPPVIVYLSVMALLTLLGVLTIPTIELVGSLVFFRNFLDSATRDGWYTGHFWSLSVEEHFYLFWPLVLAGLGATRSRLFAVIFAALVAAWRWHEYQQPWFGQLFPKDIFFARSDMRLDSLMWGAWGALIFGSSWWCQIWRRASSRWLWLAAVLALLTSFRFKEVNLITLQGLLIVALLTGTVLRPSGLRARLLESRPLRYLGRLSYSLYIWQQFFLVGSRQVRPLPLPLVQTWPWTLVALVLMVGLSYYLVERPMIEVGRRLLQHRAKKPADLG